MVWKEPATTARRSVSEANAHAQICAIACAYNYRPMDAAEKIRLLVCGDSGVGKKRLIEAFTTVGERKTSTLSTIGKLIIVRMCILKLTIRCGRSV